MAQHTAPSLSALPGDALQLVFGSAQPEDGARLACCARFLLSEAKRCQALWDHALAQGQRQPFNYRVLAAAVKALTAEEAPALEAGSELLGRVGKATVMVAMVGGLHETHEAKWQAGLEAAEAFKEVPEAQAELLYWLGGYARHVPGIEGVEYAVSVMERFPQHEDVQYNGCYALCHLFYRHPALKERGGELGAVEALVHALDRAAFNQGGLRYLGVRALDYLTNGHAANAARLEAAGGAHYLQ